MRGFKLPSPLFLFMVMEVMEMGKYWVYQHTNGKLIPKIFRNFEQIGDFEESPFCVAFLCGLRLSESGKQSGSG